VPVAVAGCGAGTELVCENFDGTEACGDGSHTNCNTTWTKVQAGDAPGPVVDFNYATSPAPLEGTYSAQLYITEWGDGYVKSFTAQDTIHFFYMVEWTTFGNPNQDVHILDSSDNILMKVGNANPEFAVYCGSILGYSTTASVNTPYYVWGEYTKGTGANAVCKLYHSTNTTKGAADITVSNGDATAQAAKVKIIASAPAVRTIFDKIRIGTSAFGDNPQ
jgi:hypothetical protein